jgi:hypothetical protein
MTEKKRHSRGYRDDSESRERRAIKHSFKQYIEDIRLREALEEDEDDDLLLQDSESDE